jgi:tetratricopeptide (TPR) repeat protein
MSHLRSLIAAVLGVLLVAPAATATADRATKGRRLGLVRVDREPRDGRRAVTDEEIARLRQAVVDAARDRSARLELCLALAEARRLDEALREARAWRAHDAYNLVVVRLIGDLLAERGDLAAARRSYSAVVELLAQDPQAHRALATVMRQSGDLQGAYDRLAAAAALRPDDLRIAFELADTAQRLRRDEEATRRFQEIVARGQADESVRYPAKQRLVQLYSAQRREALRGRNAAAASGLGKKIEELAVRGRSVNDLKVYLTWDTDRSDVDLWVTAPGGQKIYYEHKQGPAGEELFHDVTSGYGPESFTAHQATPGTYLVQVNYYGTPRQTFSEARGEVTVILNEGTEAEERHVLPYRLFKPKQTVTVAKIVVGVGDATMASAH